MQHSRPVQWLIGALAVVSVVLAYSLLFGPYGLPGLRERRQAVAERSARVLDRVQANQDLQARLDSLRDDPRAVEAELRSSQNWVRPGEVMIVLPSGENPTTPR